MCKRVCTYFFLYECVCVCVCVCGKTLAKQTTKTVFLM